MDLRGPDAEPPCDFDFMGPGHLHTENMQDRLDVGVRYMGMHVVHTSPHSLVYARQSFRKLDSSCIAIALHHVRASGDGLHFLQNPVAGGQHRILVFNAMTCEQLASLMVADRQQNTTVFLPMEEFEQTNAAAAERMRLVCREIHVAGAVEGSGFFAVDTRARLVTQAVESLRARGWIHKVGSGDTREKWQFTGVGQAKVLPAQSISEPEQMVAPRAGQSFEESTAWELLMHMERNSWERRLVDITEYMLSKRAKPHNPSGKSNGIS